MKNKRFLLIIALTAMLSSAMAYERVEDGIKLGNVTYPVILSEKALNDIDNKFPSLIDWLLSSEAATKEQKQYLLGKLPTMKEKLRRRLHAILLKERRKLEKLNQQYQENIGEINRRIAKSNQTLSPEELEKIKQRMIEKMKAERNDKR